MSERVAPGLRRTLLDYREIRVGVGATYGLNAGLSLELDGGTTVDRRFDYFDHGRKIKAEDAPYLTLALRGRF